MTNKRYYNPSFFIKLLLLVTVLMLGGGKEYVDVVQYLETVAAKADINAFILAP